MRTSVALIAAAITGASFAVPIYIPLAAQSASLVYRLGNDTVAVEQFTRTPTSMNGEMVQRNGAAVVRYQYSLVIGRDGRPTAATIKRMNADGSIAPNTPTETRFTVRADSIVREAVFADSVQRRAFAAKQALINFPVFVYGPVELLAALRKAGTPTDSIPALALAGGLGFAGFAVSGDTLRLRGGAYAMVLRFDTNSRLQQLDGSGTTNKVIATRSAAAVNIAAMASAMKPTGILSVREDVRAAFGPGGMVVVDYGRPSVRERTVWGGTLVPLDSVWRAGANDATHLFTTRTLTMGSLTLPPGMYSLWVQHTRNGTFLIVNKQTGQWGTQYDASQDVGKVQMQLTDVPSHVEVFALTVKALGPTRGALEMAWGPSVASVQFGVGSSTAR